jgi:hypothetical protein
MTRAQPGPVPPRSAPVAAVTPTRGKHVGTATAGASRPVTPPVPLPADHGVGGRCAVIGCPVVRVSSDERPSVAHRVRPYQAAKLARVGAAAFARHGDQHRGLAASMFLAFLVGGGCQQAGATLTLWRVWPRWSAPVTTAATAVGMLAIVQVQLPMGLAVPAWMAAGALAIAGLLRVASGWTGLPAGSMLIGDVAASGAPGAGRRLLAVVCTEADRCGWTLALLARRGRPALLALNRDLLFEPVGVRGVRLVNVRRQQR